MAIQTFTFTLTECLPGSVTIPNLDSTISYTVGDPSKEIDLDVVQATACGFGSSFTITPAQLSFASISTNSQGESQLVINTSDELLKGTHTFTLTVTLDNTVYGAATAKIANIPVTVEIESGCVNAVWTPDTYSATATIGGPDIYIYLEDSISTDTNVCQFKVMGRQGLNKP